MKPVRTLYVCYFGLREPLVQTQVLPYLRQLQSEDVQVISTGNIGNPRLETLFAATIQRVVEGFDAFDFIEIERTRLIFHV